MGFGNLRRISIFLLPAALLGGAALFAQENSGNIYGRVLDEEGRAVAKAEATLTGPTAPRTTTTDESGRFRFLAIDPGSYTVIVTAPGFATVENSNVRVTLGQNTEFSVKLSLGGVKETVTVSSVAPLIDARKTETGVTFYREELQQIPNARDVWSMMQQVPGIQMDTVNVAGNSSGNQPNVATKGSNQGTYRLDGVTITDNSYGAFEGGQNGKSPSYFDFDTFQEVEISTGGSTLELETPGVTVNVVTKRGTNELHGSGRFFYASDDWQSDNTSDEAREQELQTNSTRFIREYGVELGGPILRDRLWIWGSVARQDISLNLNGTSSFFEGAGPRTITLEPWNAKLNAQLSNANSANFFFSRSDRTELNTGSGTTRAPETLRDLFIDSNLYKVEDSHVFSPSLFATANYSHLEADYSHTPQPGTENNQVLYDADGVFHRGYKYLITTNPQDQVNLSASKFFNTGDVSHELKFGFGYRNQENDSASAWPGDQILTSETSIGYGYAQLTRGVRTRYEQRYWHGTLGDTLSIGNLTVNAGIRYDVQQGRNLASEAFENVVFPELLPGLTSQDDEGWPIEHKDWQPRISATYALGKEKKTLLRASYARFANQLGSFVYQLNSFPINSGLYYYWADQNGDRTVQRNEVDLDSFCCFYNVDPNVIPPNALDPNLETPTTDEIVLGVDRQLTSDLAVSVAYTYRHFDHLQMYTRIGSDASSWELVGLAAGTATAANGFTLSFSEPYYFLNLPEDPSGDLYRNRPGSTQTFHGVELQVVKRLSNRWSARVGFAWQDWTQDTSEEAIALNPNNEWLLGAPNDDGGIAVGYGRETIWFNADWQFNISGLYQAPWGINVAANFFGRQGNPTGYYVRTNNDGQYAARHRPSIGHLDDFRLDDIYELDMRIEKAFHLGPLELTPSVDVFNVLNDNAVIQRDPRVGDVRLRSTGVVFTENSSFNQILETQSPRIVRLGLRLTF